MQLQKVSRKKALIEISLLGPIERFLHEGQCKADPPFFNLSFYTEKYLLLGTTSQS